MSMDLGLNKKGEELRDRICAFIDKHVLPVEEEYFGEVGGEGDRWTLTKRMTEIIEGLKDEAKKQGLWNFWLTDSKSGFGLTCCQKDGPGKGH